MPIRKGVKYLKIAKTDASGVDRTDTLRQLRSINIKYTDIGVVQYDIKSRSEYSTYLLYRVDYMNPTSSVDRGVLDYVTNTTAITGPTALTANQSASVTGYGTTNTYFNGTTGLYTFSQRLPNTLITFTASANGGPAAPGNVQPFVRLVLTGSNFTRTVISQSQAISPVSVDTQVTVSGSFIVPAENAQYYLEVANGGVATVPCDFSTINLKVSQSIASTGNTAVITSPAPDTNELFTGTDCDVTYGVADEYPSSQYYMETDYSTGILVPTNFDKIISQSATLAAVKDYYYVLKRQTKPRYEGSRTNTYKINEYTPANDSIIIDGNPYEGDEGYIKDPGIENKKVYFGWFQEVYGAAPEVNNAVNVNVKYLINEISGTLSPNLDSFFLGELRDTFQQGENLELSFVDAKDGTNSTPTAIKTALNGKRTIIRSGAKVVPIMYSQTGSGTRAYTNSLDFKITPGVLSETVVTNYQFLATTGSNSQVPIPLTAQIRLFDEKYDLDTAYDTSSGEYTFKSAPPTDLRFFFQGKIKHLPPLPGVAAPTTVVLEIRKNGTAIGSNRYVVRSTTLFGGETEASFAVDTPRSVRYNTGDVISIHVSADNTNSYFSTPIEFGLGQFSLGTSLSVNIPYFYSSSVDRTILTASAQFAPILGNTSQTDIPASGFDSILNQASFNVGDQLRFENDENKVYTINGILTSSIQNQNKETYLLLDQPLLPNINTDYFLLRRFIDDPTNIVVQAIKPAGGTGAGTIRPQYITNTLDNNLGRVVQKLQQQNTI